MGTLRHFSPHMTHCGTSDTDTDCPFAYGTNFELLHQGDHAYQWFTCVTQLIRQRRSVTRRRLHCATPIGGEHPLVRPPRRPVVLPYSRDMPAGKRPAPEDTVTARRVLLDGLARDADLFELVSELAPLHPRDNTFPGEVFLAQDRRQDKEGHHWIVVIRPAGVGHSSCPECGPG